MSRRVSSGVLALLFSMCGVSRARADDAREACIATHVETQKLRRSGQFVEALSRARICGLGACPAPIAADCGTWALELEDVLTSNDPRVRVLFEVAVNLMSTNQHDDACPKLEEALRRDDRSSGARFKLAECYEGAGNLARAFEGYRRVEAQLANEMREARRRQAHDRAEALAPRLARLRIVVDPAVRSLAGLEIRRDGIPFASVEWDTVAMVDKGLHTVVASATNKKTWEKTMYVPADGSEHTLTINALEIPRASRVGLGQQRITGLTLGAVGLGWLGIGGVFGVLMLQKNAQSNGNNHCHGDMCDATGGLLRYDAIKAGNIETALVVLGGAALATGVIVFTTASRRASPMNITVGLQGLRIGGVW